MSHLFAFAAGYGPGSTWLWTLVLMLFLISSGMLVYVSIRHRP